MRGYPGSNEYRLAVERGEIEGSCPSWSAIPQDWIVNHRINVLVRFSPKRPPDMPASVPYVVDSANTQEQRDLLLVLNGPSEVGRPLIVAKEVPRERVAPGSAPRNAARRPFFDRSPEAESPARSGQQRGGGRDYQVDLFDSAGTREASEGSAGIE